MEKHHLTDLYDMKNTLCLDENATPQTGSKPLKETIPLEEGRVPGQGHYTKADVPYAEIQALLDIHNIQTEITLSGTLKPSRMSGKIPDCSEKMFNVDIRRAASALIGRLVPRRIEKNGNHPHCTDIDIENGMLKPQAHHLDKASTTHRTTTPGLPCTIFKLTMSFDEKTLIKGWNLKCLAENTAYHRAQSVKTRLECCNECSCNDKNFIRSVKA